MNSDGSLDESFQVGTGAEGKITQVAGDPLEPNLFQVAVESDGKVVIIGNFATYNGVARSGIARLNSDGSLDTTFDPGAGFDSWGRSIHLLDDGRMIATGWFTSYDNHSFNRMVVLSSTGQPDLSFKPFFGDKTSIYDMAPLSDGRMIVVGHSINDQGLFRREIARINPDGSFDDSFVGTTSDKTETVRLQPDGKIVVGGYFSLADGVSRSGVARLNPDGTLDPDFSASFDNFVWTVAFDGNGKLLASGGFTAVDGLPRGGIVRLNTGLPTSSNHAPTVTIISPTNNTTFKTSANVNITANASDTDGTIVRVRFYSGLDLVGEKTNAPYTISLTNLALGNYQLTARATDNGGAVTASTSIQITVIAATNEPPAISILSPTNNAILSAPLDLVIEVNADDPDGSISKVEFFNARRLLGQASTSPFTFTLSNAPAGNYALLARATDNLGAVTVSNPTFVTIQTGTPGGPAFFWNPITNGMFLFLIRSGSNQTYVVESATNLQAPTWQTVTNITGTGADIQILQPANQPAEFFRMRTE